MSESTTLAYRSPVVIGRRWTLNISAAPLAAPRRGQRSSEHGVRDGHQTLDKGTARAPAVADDDALAFLVAAELSADQDHGSQVPVRASQALR